jgi:hypothetical protein
MTSNSRVATFATAASTQALDGVLDRALAMSMSSSAS